MQGKPQKQFASYEEEVEYKKLYKAFGNDNKNKDLRRGVQGEIEGNQDKQLSTGMSTNMNPGFRLE
eukprot:CAMPEP_0176379448 /NCGR_PEP_ID=MMETSP0126-20121128/30366_1 /TAXON_ID=141414 ORGANISM="Strombidinopsis acuminatum, Strain SPMC142" /NCGR_SAMPLE_ID=MMETSP0126 /ASSEMBLY_ACC=CAM_ASM_000229 /LENGTH=65 /DNA_ID=CAMNT_0017742231 /DNA_START=124 /DNA_END=321 /DNA_ORIENTATION=+